MDDVKFAHDGLYGGMSIALQLVTSPRRRAQTPLLRRIGRVASYTMAGAETSRARGTGAESAMYYYLVSL